MRHPFDGVNDPQGQLTRRAALGALAGLGLAPLVQAQIAVTNALNEQGGRVTTQALGEEGGTVATTLAVGEEGGRPIVNRPVTTEPFGEEAGKVVSRAVPGLEDGGAARITQALRETGATTKRLGEEGGPIATTLALGEEGGPVTDAIGEAGGVTTYAVGEEGGLTRARGEEGRGGIVPVKPGTTQLHDAQLQGVWKDLGDRDAARAVQACAVLYGCKTAVPFLKNKLKAEHFQLPQVSEQLLKDLIAGLDADAFSTREKAAADLRKLGPAAIVAMEKALAESTSAEQQRSLKGLLDESRTSDNMGQARRGLEVLVALQTAEARELLETLARGDTKEWLTQAARQARERMPR